MKKRLDALLRDLQKAQPGTRDEMRRIIERHGFIWLPDETLADSDGEPIKPTCGLRFKIPAGGGKIF